MTPFELWQRLSRPDYPATYRVPGFAVEAFPRRESPRLIVNRVSDAGYDWDGWYWLGGDVLPGWRRIAASDEIITPPTEVMAAVEASLGVAPLTWDTAPATTTP